MSQKTYVNVHEVMSTIFCVDRVVTDHGALLCWVITIGNVCRSKLHPVWNHTSQKQEIDSRSKRSRTKSFFRILAARKLEREQKNNEVGGGTLAPNCARPGCERECLLCRVGN